MVLFAAAAGLPLAVKGRALALPKGVELLTWRGVALGAPAKITLAHKDRTEAERIIARCVAEIERLERLFSLYRADSELSRLNRDGTLSAPSQDMVEILAASQHFGALTEGAFDVTVQPLWELYADHFARHPESPSGPGRRELAAALARVDYRAIEIGPRRVRLARPDMAITLNGIAQGYLTDRVADLLRTIGLRQVLVELGETRALDDHPDGRPWRIGLADPLDPDRITETVALVDQALATSAGSGTVFGGGGRFHHLFDPRTGASAAHHLSASVIAKRAATADALSTALYVLAPDRTQSVVTAAAGVTAIMTLANGERRRLTS